MIKNNPSNKIKKNHFTKEFQCLFAVSGEILIKAKDEVNAREKFFDWYGKNVEKIKKLDNELLKVFKWQEGDHKSSDILFDIFKE